MMNRQAFFLGCVIPLRFPGIEVAARRVFSQLGIERIDLEGYSCCPEPVILGLTDRDMALAVSARNLALAEKAGADLIVLCSSDAEYLALAQEVCPAAGVPVIVAGNPKEQIEALKAAGVAGFIHIQSDAVQTLTEWQKRLGMEE